MKRLRVQYFVGHGKWKAVGLVLGGHVTTCSGGLSGSAGMAWLGSGLSWIECTTSVNQSINQKLPPIVPTFAVMTSIFHARSRTSGSLQSSYYIHPPAPGPYSSAQDQPGSLSIEPLDTSTVPHPASSANIPHYSIPSP